MSAAISHGRDFITVERDVRYNAVVGFLNHDGTRRKNIVVCPTMAWIDLLMQANWKDRTEVSKGLEILVRRGQLQGARGWLAARWGWTEKRVRWFLEQLRREEMATVDQPEVATISPHGLGPAKRPAQGPAKANKTGVITICNYDLFQSFSALKNYVEGQQQGQDEGQRGASEGPDLNIDTREQKKEEDSPYSPPVGDGAHPSVWIAPDGLPKVVNGKRAMLEKLLGGRTDLDLDAVLAEVAPRVSASPQAELWGDLTTAVAEVVVATPKPQRKRQSVPEVYTKDFEDFWAIYPRRTGKGGAFKRWQALTLAQKRKAYVALKAQLPALMAEIRPGQGNYCPYPATWLNQGRFDDDPATEFERTPALVLKSDRHLEGVL